MTGEMHSIDPDGNDSNGESWPVHAAVARALGCELRPFDKYCGPYIAHAAGKIWLYDEAGPRVCIWPRGIPPSVAKPHGRCRDYGAPAAIAAVRALLRDVRRAERRSRA